MPAELSARHRDEHKSRHCEAEVTDATPARSRLDRSQRQEHDRDPLDEDRGDPGRARPLAPSARAERESRHHEQRHPRIVVPATCEVQRQQRIPADERCGVGTPAGEQRRECHRPQHRERGQRLEQPGCRVRRGSRRARYRFRRKREERPVDGRGVVVGAAHVRVCRVVRKVTRRLRVGVGVVDEGDAAVVPVGPRVAGDQQRCAERRELNRHRQRRDERQSNGRAPQQEQADDVGGKGGDLAREIEPGPGCVAFEQATVARDERGIVRPGRGDADADTGKRQQPGAENGGVTASGQAKVVGVAECSTRRRSSRSAGAGCRCQPRIAPA